MDPHEERDPARPTQSAAGQESVWDYPRPPRVEPTSERVVVRFGGEVVAETDRALRVLETSHPPTYYIPRDDFVDGCLVAAEGRSYCEFKGDAAYLDVVAPGAEDRDPRPRAERAAWTYPRPSPGYQQLVAHVALYPGRMDGCTVDGEQVEAQEGDFYGGWITSRVVGPFKGTAGTRGW